MFAATNSTQPQKSAANIVLIHLLFVYDNKFNRILFVLFSLEKFLWSQTWAGEEVKMIKLLIREKALDNILLGL